MKALFRILAICLALSGCGPQQTPPAQSNAVVEPPQAVSYLLFEVEPQPSVLDPILQVVRRRIDSAGFGNVSVKPQEPNRLRVETPALESDELDRLIDILTRPGVLTFNLVDESADPEAYEVGVERSGRIALPDDSLGGQKQVLFSDPIITGPDLMNAQLSLDIAQRPNILFDLTQGGAKRFGRATTENVGRQLAVVVDGRIISAPRIMSPINGGSGQISGNFTQKEAEDLATILRSGALPAKLKLIERSVIGGK